MSPGPDGIDANRRSIEFILREPTMPLLKRGARFESSKVGAETVVHAVTQGQMSGECSMDVETFGVHELAVIVIR